MKISSILPILVIATFGFAQSSSAPAGRRSHHVSMPGGERTMRGCVSKEESGSGGFLLQTARGHKVRLNSPEDLTTHVGQEVKVSGGFVDADDPGNASSASGSTMTQGSASPAKANREFKVVKVEIVSASCPAVKSNKQSDKQ